jgi:hypothetical protein
MRLITLTSITGAGEDMFDEYTDSQTETADEISKTFSVAGFNCVCLFNTYGIEATLTIGANVQTISLVRDSIKDWWDYWFAPNRIGLDCVFYFPTQPAATDATLSITYSGGTAKCGMCITGFAREIATTRQDVSIGISDYSRYITNEFGQTYLNAGNWAKLVDADLFVLSPADNFDITYREVVKNRGVACVFDYNEYSSTLSEYHTSEDNYSSLVVYGFTESFDPKITPALAEIRHEAQGLI